MAEKILHNGEVVDKIIGINSESLFFNYGYGLFETILYRNGELVFYDEHIERLSDSLDKIGKTVELGNISKEKILGYINGLPDKTEDLRVKIVVMDNLEEQFSTVVNAFNYIRSPKEFSVWIDSQIKDLEISNYKSLNYMHNLMRKELFAKKADVDEVLFLNKKERILEGSYTNIAVVWSGNIYFVEKRENYLDGVMQQQVEKAYKELGFKKVIYKKRGFSTKLLRQCDEVILLNSLQIAVTVGKIFNQKKDRVIIPQKKGYSQKIREYFL